MLKLRFAERQDLLATSIEVKIKAKLSSQNVFGNEAKIIIKKYAVVTKMLC